MTPELCMKKQCGDFFNTAKYTGNLQNACLLKDEEICTDKWTTCDERSSFVSPDHFDCTYNANEDDIKEPTAMGYHLSLIHI